MTPSPWRRQVALALVVAPLAAWTRRATAAPRDGHDHGRAVLDGSAKGAAAAGGHAAGAAPKALVDLSASFKVNFQPKSGRGQSQTWSLVRRGAEIVWSKGDTLDEIWRLEASGIALQRVMHDERHVIEYSAGELRTLGVAVDWRELASLLGEHDLASLSSVRLARLPAGQTLYRGRLAGDQVEVLWDDVACLPIRMIREGSKGRVQMVRQAVEWGGAAANDATRRASDYARLDAADFGDMEYNPVVRRVMAQEERLGWRRAHSH